MKIGKVHSVFKNVINFIDDKGQLYSIGNSYIDNGPYHIRVFNKEHKDFLNFKIPLGTPIYANIKKINITNYLSIWLNRGSVWVPNIDIVDNINIDSFNKNIKIFELLLLKTSRKGGAKYYYISENTKNYGNYNATLIERETKTRINKFISCLMSKHKSLDKSIEKLVGFGNGLTPTGDDFLTGFIISMTYIRGNEHKHEELDRIKEVLKKNKLCTTDISKSMLKSAINGEARETILDFIQVLIMSNEQEFRKKCENIFSIGSSSGIDLAVGVVIGTKFCLNVL